MNRGASTSGQRIEKAWDLDIKHPRLQPDQSRLFERSNNTVLLVPPKTLRKHTTITHLLSLRLGFVIPPPPIPIPFECPTLPWCGAFELSILVGPLALSTLFTEDVAFRKCDLSIALASAACHCRFECCQCRRCHRRCSRRHQNAQSTREIT